MLLFRFIQFNYNTLYLRWRPHNLRFTFHIKTHHMITDRVYDTLANHVNIV
jgi:hypothetical protein